MNEDQGWKLKDGVSLDPHQIQTYQQSKKYPRWADWSQTGTGKSLPALCLMLHRMHQNKVLQRGAKAFDTAGPRRNAIVLTPASALTAWETGALPLFEHTGDVECVVYRGTRSQRDKLRTEWEKTPHIQRVVFLSWGFLSSNKTIADLAWLKTVLNPHYFILDEAQYISAMSASRTKETHNWIDPPTGRRDFPQISILTATPLEDGAHKIWSLFELLFISPLTGRNIAYPMGQDQFISTHFDVQINRQFGLQVTYSPVKRERGLFDSNMARFSIRHLRETVFKGRQEPRYSVRTFSMDPHQAALYWYLLDNLALTINETEIDLSNVYQRMLRERQLAADPAILGFESRHSRFIALQDLIKEIGCNEKIVIITENRWTWNFLRKQLKNSTGILGGMGPQQRINAINQFTNDPNCTLFIGSRNAMAEGINLQVASIMINFEIGFTVSKFHQAHGRIDRRGQEQRCCYITLCAEDTIDYYVHKRLIEKTGFAQELLQEITRVTKHGKIKVLTSEEKQQIEKVLKGEHYV